MRTPPLRIIWRIVRTPLVAIIGFLIVLALLQDRLLYFPETASVAETVAATGIAGARAWPSAEDFRGVLVDSPATPPPSALRGTAILFHGNAGHAGHRGDFARELARLGLRVILAEYPGYGARGGKSGEAVFVADAREIRSRARREFGEPIFIVGESLGAAVASLAVGDAVARGETIAGLLLTTPWDRLARVAAHHYPWLPVGLLLADRYDSVAALAAYAGPTVIVVASDDEVVPPQFGKTLHDSFSGRKQIAIVAGARHNDWIFRVDAAWWNRVGAALRPAP